MSHPTILFGGGSLGHGKFAGKEGQEMLQWLHSNGIERFDTAALYPLSSPGGSEQLLGDFQTANKGRITVDTKILLTDFSGKGSLTPDAIEKSLNASLSRLPGGINTLYCHLPDPETPVEVTAKALDQHFVSKRFQKLGLSNFPDERVTDFVRSCKENQLRVKPMVYQGQYNALCRGAESTLLPTLREHGMYFMAYSPIAGGFLTGKFTNGKDVKGTRFEEGHPGAKVYKGMYDKPEMHGAVRKLEAAAAKYEMGIAEACLRWIYWHSALKEGDGIILGATRMGQIKQNLEEIQRGPLPDEFIGIFDEVWADVCAKKE